MSAQLAEQITVPLQSSLERPTVVIGTGPVGIQVAQEILRHEAERPLVLFGDEPWQPYNRVQLSALLAGELNWEALQNPLKTDAVNRVLQHHNCAIVSIDAERRELVDRAGRVHAYSQLILAVGSRPHIPSIPGISQAGVFRFRDMNDMQALAARNARSRHAVVLGGGLLGLEAARGLRRAGTEVTIVEHAPQVMPKQLDETASELLVQHLNNLGIQVLLGDSVQRILGNGKLTGVRLRKHGTVSCDTLVVATGIRPNIDLARNCGLRVNRGIVIDDYCRTSNASIFAVGECAEHRGQVYGLVGPGLDQAAVLAHYLTNQPARYTGSVTATRLKVLKRTVFSIGQVNEKEDPMWLRAIVYQDRSAGSYRKLVIRRARLVGAIAVGDWHELSRIQEAVQSERLIFPWQLARFTRSGRLWPDSVELGVHDWPATAVVCNCRGITRLTLSNALAGGSTTVEQLMQTTGASTVCGGCRPLLAQMIGAGSTPADKTGLKALLIVCCIALPILLTLTLPAQWLDTNTVQSPLYSFSQIWHDGLWKQVTGFTLLSLAVIGSIVSLRKRVRKLQWGHYGYWRFAHGVLGVLALVVLLLHTGLQFGERLNAWLLTNYLALAVFGVAAGIAASYASTYLSRNTRRIQRLTNWTHLLLAWPLPVLLGFHVLTVYYF